MLIQAYEFTTHVCTILTSVQSESGDAPCETRVTTQMHFIPKWLPLIHGNSLSELKGII